MTSNILQLLNREKSKSLAQNQLADKLKIQPKQKEAFHQALRELEFSGKIARVKGNFWVLAREAGLVAGSISFHEKGFAFLRPENDTDGEDIFIPAEETGTALHRDQVLVRINEKGSGGARFRRGKRLPNEKREGKVVRILQRKRETVVGVLEKPGNFYLVVPDDPKLLHSFYVPEPKKNPVPAKLGDKVVVRLTEWVSRHANPEGKIIERLGKADEVGVDILSIIRKYELPEKFPKIVEKAAGSVSSKIAPEHGRLDLRKEFTVTIDPETAKDFDDALSLKELSQGEVEIGVHIADVAHYVQPGSELDKEARKRANSTYLLNQVIPMLPEKLSNGLCSLVPHQDRYTRSVLIHFDAKGNILSHKIARTLIHSDHRLAYPQALARLNQPPKNRLDHVLHRLWKIASILRKQRFQNGSLDLDFPELKVRLNDDGKAVALEKVENDISHQLIEEFMLLANDIVAQTLKQKHIPTLYRVHDKPEPSKLEEYREFLIARGMKPGDLTKGKELQKILRQINQRPDKDALKLGLLKSLQRAEYKPKPLGHFGLAKTNYTHFTSPIRRYADLIVHRSLDKQRISVGELEKIGKHLSERERNSSEAEMELTKLKTLEYFAEQLEKDKRGKGAAFPAVVVDVQNFGFFVELPDFAISGLVHFSSLKDDLYQFDSRRLLARGKRTNKTYTIGDKLRVKVSRIDFIKRQIDFTVAG